MLPEGLESHVRSRPPAPFQGAVAVFREPQSGNGGLHGEEGESRQHGVEISEFWSHSQAPPVKEEGEEDGLRDVGGECHASHGGEKLYRQVRSVADDQKGEAANDRDGETEVAYRSDEFGPRKRIESPQGKPCGKTDEEGFFEEGQVGGHVFKEPQSARVQSEEEEPEGLPDAPGFDEVFPFACLSEEEVPFRDLRKTAVQEDAVSVAADVFPLIGEEVGAIEQMLEQGNETGQKDDAGQPGDEQGRRFASMEGYEQKTLHGEQGEDVSIIKDGVNRSHDEEESETPGESRAEVDAPRRGSVHLDEEADAEKKGEEHEGFACEEVQMHPVGGGVERGDETVGLLWVDVAVKMIVGMRQKDAEEGEGSQQVDDVNP